MLGDTRLPLLLLPPNISSIGKKPPWELELRQLTSTTPWPDSSSPNEQHRKNTVAHHHARLEASVGPEKTSVAGENILAGETDMTGLFKGSTMPSSGHHQLSELRLEPGRAISPSLSSLLPLIARSSHFFPFGAGRRH